MARRPGLFGVGTLAALTLLSPLLKSTATAARPDASSLNSIEPRFAIHVDPCISGARSASAVAQELARVFARLAQEEPARCAIEAVAPDLVIVALPRGDRDRDRAIGAIESLGLDAEPVDRDLRRSEP